MKYNKKKLDKLIVRHKKLVSALGYYVKENKNVEQDMMTSLLTQIQRTGKEISLVIAEFKCEKSGETENLQYHHAISRTCKKMMPFWKYITQRNYWANIVILSRTLHQGEKSEVACIPQTFIDKIKKKYDFCEEGGIKE